MNSPFQYEPRLARARTLMHNQGLDYIIVGPSADLLYLTGVYRNTSERMTLLMLPQEGPAHLVLPAFEAVNLPSLPDEVHVRTWTESDNPARLAATLISHATHSHPGGVSCTIGVGDLLWSVFLLRLQAELPRATFTPASPVLSAARQFKSPEEIDALREASSATDMVFDEIRSRPFAGRSEIDVADEIKSRLRSRGLQVPGQPIVASGPNSAAPHHHTGERTIQRGDIVVLDFGGTYQGYYSDLTRTVFVGEAPPAGSEQVHIYGLVATAQEAAVKAARAGTSCESLDSVARNILSEQGMGEYFTHRLGHGIGLEGHEPPYLVQGNATILKKGMSFTIEPGLYLPGNFGVRIEDVVYLDENGAVRLNNADRAILVVS